MNYRLRWVAMLCALFPLYAYGGGNPEFVKLPEGYKDSFAKYTTQNRAGHTQVVKIYANETALSSYKESHTANAGSVIVMEIYKSKKDDKGNPVKGPDGIYEAGSLAAVAVMEKQYDWDESYSQYERAGSWGFALYTPEGEPMSNKLDCAGCHTPRKSYDYLFTQRQLIQYARNR